MACSDLEPLDHAAIEEVLADDLVDVGLVDVGVADLLRVDHHHRPFLAAVEAARLVDAHLALAGELQPLHAGLGVIADPGCAGAVAALLAVRALVAAEEHMMLVVAHRQLSYFFSAAGERYFSSSSRCFSPPSPSGPGSGRG